MGENSFHQVARSYHSVFLLDNSKISRLTNIIEGRFKNIGNPFFTSFEIETSKSKTFSTPKLESILEHDNAINNPIVSLIISYNNDKDKRANSCTIIFNKMYRDIDIRITSEDPKWANDLFAEIDEQIERILVHSWVYSQKKRMKQEILLYSAGLTVILALMSLLVIFAGMRLTVNYLTSSDVEYLEKMRSPDANIDAKVEFLYQMHSRQLLNSKQIRKSFYSLSDLKNYINLRTLLILIPILLIGGCLFYLLKYCYPGAIFLWGDFIEYNERIVERRKFVWNTLILALIVGILGNLFVFGMSPFI